MQSLVRSTLVGAEDGVISCQIVQVNPGGCGETASESEVSNCSHGNVVAVSVECSSFAKTGISGLTGCGITLQGSIPSVSGSIEHFRRGCSVFHPPVTGRGWIAGDCCL